MAGVEHVEIDRRRIVHDVGIVQTGEDVARTAHVGGELVNLVETAVDDIAAEALVAQIADDEVVRRRLGEFRELEIDAAYPEAFMLQALDEMAADKTSGTADKHGFHDAP